MNDEDLSKHQKLAIFLFPSCVGVICWLIAALSTAADTNGGLWIVALPIALALPGSSSIGSKNKRLQQIGDQLGWGTVFYFAVLVVVAVIRDLLGLSS